MHLSRLAAAVLAAALAVPVVTASPASAEAYACDGIEKDTEVSATTDRSIPYQALGIEQATELLAEQKIAPGEGVKVAVVDSGVDVGDEPLAPLTVVDRQPFGTSEPVTFGHGTNVAGLVAGGEREQGGPTGIAPAAQIVDIRVYDEANENGVGGVPPDQVVDAVNWLATHAEDEGIGVVVMALSMPENDDLEKAVAALSKQDVVIVVGSGNRPQEQGQSGFDEYGVQAPGEDVGGEIVPAAYGDDVFAVSATTEGMQLAEDEVADASDSVLLSSDIDAAVPTWGAVTLAVNGSTCVLYDVATSWAAGIAGGVVALVRSAYPKENADQIEARLIASATGSAVRVNTATGHGVLQPVEALTLELSPTRTGDIDDMPRENTPQPRVTAPVAETNPVTATLGDARWWGLFGGAALVVALLARPLLRRRLRVRPVRRP